jgi:hypothetical protein
MHEERGREVVRAQQRIGVAIEAFAIVVEGEDERTFGNRTPERQVVAQCGERYDVKAATRDLIELRRRWRSSYRTIRLSPVARRAIRAPQRTASVLAVRSAVAAHLRNTPGYSNTGRRRLRRAPE